MPAESTGATRLPGDQLLVLREVSLSFGGLRAVSRVSLWLGKRELCGLIGPNGAGKTTIFNLLTGVYQPDEGEIFLGGRRLDGQPPFKIAAMGVARTFQNIRLFGELSVLDNVRVACHLRAKHRMYDSVLHTRRYWAEESSIEERSRELLRIFNLEGRALEQAKNLPYGDQRRLEIARALATHPQILLLDEPAAGMNPEEKNRLRDLIDQVRERFNLAVLLIEHDMGLVMQICERIAVLDHGHLIAVGSPETIQNDPRVIEAYLGAPAEPSKVAP